MPYHAKNAYEQLKTMNKNVAITELKGPLGHLNGISNIAQYHQQIQHFLE